MKFQLLFSFAFLLFVLPGCFTHKASFKGNSLPSEAGLLEAQKLDQLTQYIQDSSRTTGLVVLHKGKVVYSYGDVQKVSYIASCRKSVLSMLYGKHIEAGTIDLGQDIGSLEVDEKDGLLPLEKTATVDHIITSRSGVFHVASNGGYDKANFLERGSVAPGSYYVYSNWDFNVAGYILEKQTGQTVYEELEQQLAIPLGFEDWNIKNQRKSGNKRKSQYQAYHMYLSTRDMAKIGQLMLQNGEWEGEQIIPAEWVEKSTSTVTSLSEVLDRYGTPNPALPEMSYGYMWWLIEGFKGNPAYKGGYTASGYGGQFITVLPAMDMVIAHKTKLDVLTLIGLRYKDTPGEVYYSIVDQLVEAKK